MIIYRVTWMFFDLSDLGIFAKQPISVSLELCGLKHLE